jgi:hypothetical protein
MPQVPIDHFLPGRLQRSEHRSRSKSCPKIEKGAAADRVGAANGHYFEMSKFHWRRAALSAGRSDLNFPDFVPVGVQHNDMARPTRGSVFSDLSRYDESFLGCFLIVIAIQPGRIDQPMAVFDIEKIARHLSLRGFSNRQRFFCPSVPPAKTIELRSRPPKFKTLNQQGHEAM